jgi:hypothetical protein
MDYLAEILAKEDADALFEEEVQQALQQTQRVKMTEQQKLEYTLYRKGCQINGVEPVRADFLMGKINDSVVRYMELQQNEVEQEHRERAMAAVA